MPLVRDSLQMIFLPARLDESWTQDQVNDFKQICTKRAWVTQERCGVNKNAIVEGGFARYWFEQSERPRLYANHQGGYRVSCPKCSQNVAGAFAASVQAWRAGGVRSLKCTGCFETLSLESCILRPSGGFACSALVFAGVEDAAISAPAQQLIDDVLGETRLVFKRIG